MFGVDLTDVRLQAADTDWAWGNGQLVRADSGSLVALPSGRDAPFSQAELGRRLRLEKSTISRLVDQLAGRGWVARGRDLRDGRAASLRLTPAGQQAAANLTAARRQKFADLLAAIPDLPAGGQLTYTTSDVEPGVDSLVADLEVVVRHAAGMMLMSMHSGVSDSSRPGTRLPCRRRAAVPGGSGLPAA
jgi:hypothetical protein